MKMIRLLQNISSLFFEQSNIDTALQIAQKSELPFIFLQKVTSSTLVSRKGGQKAAIKGKKNYTTK